LSENALLCLFHKTEIKEIFTYLAVYEIVFLLLSRLVCIGRFWRFVLSKLGRSEGSVSVDSASLHPRLIKCRPLRNLPGILHTCDNFTQYVISGWDIEGFQPWPDGYRTDGFRRKAGDYKSFATGITIGGTERS
jgi:hypothetical protein